MIESGAEKELCRVQDFRKLRVWIKANALAPKVRELTDEFPDRGYRSLREQTIAAAESIPFNIAEGCGASSPKEFARFLGIAIKSACELEAELQLALDYRIASERQLVAVSAEGVHIRRMLCVLRKRVLSNGPS